MSGELESLLSVDTPERVQIEFDIAGIGSRALAQLADVSLISFAFLLLFYFVVTAFAFKPRLGATPAAIIVFITIAAFLIQWGYFFFFEAFANGTTPGKKLCGIRVIMDDGVPITFMAAFVRNLLRVADFLPGGYALGFIFMFLHPQSRRIGDMAAGTLVVRDSKVTLAELNRTVTEISNTETAMSPLAARVAITYEEYDLISEFLGRAAGLDEGERFAIAMDIAKPFLARAALTEENLRLVNARADRYEKFVRELAKIFVVRQGMNL